MPVVANEVEVVGRYFVVEQVGRRLSVQRPITENAELLLIVRNCIEGACFLGNRRGDEVCREFVGKDDRGALASD